MPDGLPSADDFTECTTPAGLRKHYVLKTWPKLTLCGNLADSYGKDWLSRLPECIQCGKSRKRQMEGRPH